MSLKQKDALARIALTIGEYEEMRDNFDNYLKTNNLEPRDRARAELMRNVAVATIAFLEHQDESVREQWT